MWNHITKRKVYTKFRTLFPELYLRYSKHWISARKNVLGISPSAFCQIIKEDLRWYPHKMIRRHKRWWLGETFPFLLVVSASVRQVKILSKVCSWCWTWICFEFAAQQTSTVKLPAFFLRFQTEERVRRVNKSKITGQNTFNGDHFEIERNPESSKGKKTFWVFFYRFVTTILTLRPRNTYIYVFQALFGFCNF